jgi:hypothetical protein
MNKDEASIISNDCVSFNDCTDCQHSKDIGCKYVYFIYMKGVGDIPIFPNDPGWDYEKVKK